MTQAPETLEGWWALHDIRRIDWTNWKSVSPARRDSILAEASRVLEDALALRDAEAGCSALYRILGQKGDLMTLHLRPSIDHLSALELAFAQTDFADYTLPAFSYLSIVELSLHGGGAEQAAASDYARRRLYPELPGSGTVCFYPMSKRRRGEDNWYLLPPERRRELMRDHGLIGRKYAGRVQQIITGSIGLDDWEWGVTLFAEDPVWFKKVVHEMRFDEASARYAEFGPFFVGIRLEPSGLRSLLKGR